MEMRFRVPKETHRQSYIKAKTEIRPLFNRLTPHGALNSRSPLVSMIFPSLKDKTNIFTDENITKENTDKPRTAGNTMYVKRAELEQIVEQETRRRAGVGHVREF